MNKGSKYKSGQRPTFRIWDNEKNDWFEPTYEGWDGKIEELLLSPTGDLTMRTFADFKHESLFPERFEIVLDEPQKVKVPAFVVNLVTEYREKYSDITFYGFVKQCSVEGFGNNESPEGHVTSWLTRTKENESILMRVWLDESGYEVEEPEEWVVKVKRMYFLNWGEDGTCPTFVLDDNPRAKLQAKPFIKSEGQALAESLKGSIEKV